MKPITYIKVDKRCKGGMYGKHHSEESKNKIGLASLGNTHGFKKGQIPWNKIGTIPLTRLEIIKRYRLKNPEKVKKWRQSYHEKHKESPQYILATCLRKKLCKIITKKERISSTVDFLGCSINKLKSHIEKKFINGMTWKNHGLFGWHIDHIIPLDSFDLTNHKQLAQACHYTNLQPLWAKDNLKKGIKI